MMRYSQDGLKLTEGFEGYRDRSYQDVGGVWTIAYGHTRGVGPGLTCIRAQGDSWAIEDLGYAEALVNDLVVNEWPTLKDPITQNEFDAIVDFEFNTGGLKGSSMLRYLQAGDIHNAALEFDKWDHVHGKVVADLLKRREAERTLFEQPDKPGDPEAGAD